LLTFDSANNINVSYFTVFHFYFIVTLQIIDTKDRKVISTTTMLQTAPITTIIHPATYINKFLIAYSNGQLDLWNANKGKLVHTFASLRAYFQRKHNTKSASAVVVPAISVMEQSPACDVVAVGFESGDILLLNLKLDLVLFSFEQDCGVVTSLSFRTDVASDKFPFLASSGNDGRIFIWNLGTKATDTNDEEEGASKIQLERKLQSIITEAHSARVSKVHFLHGEPVLISSSIDNSIKMWIFDSSDGSARLLRGRSGHSGYPLRIRYYGGATNASMNDNPDAFSCELVSSGSDCTLRSFNTAIESQNVEMSQKPLLEKLRMKQRNSRLPVVLSFDACESREKNWGNLVSIHQNSCETYIWMYRNRVVTENVLKQPHWRTNDLRYTPDVSTHSTAVCLSSCGNYCAVGNKGGDIFLYNLQSSIPRGAYPDHRSTAGLHQKEVVKRQATPGNVLHLKHLIHKEGEGAHANSLNPISRPALPTAAPAVLDEGHSKEVTGLFVDMANLVMVSCSMDGQVIFWDFDSHAVLDRYAPEKVVPHLRLQGFRDAGFVAVAGQDRVVRVFDMTSRRLIRRFTAGHSREITDMAFTPDGRRLLTSSLDETVRVWDMPTGRCLSWLAFEAPVLSITVSLSGEYLCVAQAGKEGIFMYIDRSLYETVHFWSEPVAPVVVRDSRVMVDAKELLHGVVASLEEEDEEEEDGDAKKKTTAAKDDSKSFLVKVTPSQGQITDTSPSATESSLQKSPGLITMSTVPRAYWTSLFHLELIKERNKPQAPPTVPAAAPFFLPTLVKSGATPSFPTPEEFSKLQAQQQQQQQRLLPPPASSGSGGGGDVAAELEHGSGGKKRGLGLEDKASAASSSSKKQKEGSGVAGIGEGSDELVMAELAAMGSAWSDDDGEDEDEDDWGAGEGEFVVDRAGDSANTTAVAAAVTTATVVVATPVVSTNKSRLLTKKSQMSRFECLIFLLSFFLMNHY
jgi:U3 small nucleolar RNA-associated protein 21